jgi:hypothetical protein
MEYSGILIRLVVLVFGHFLVKKLWDYQLQKKRRTLNLDHKQHATDRSPNDPQVQDS